MAGLLWFLNPEYRDTATLYLDFHGGFVHADAEVAAGDGYEGLNALTGSSWDAYVAMDSVRPDDERTFAFGVIMEITSLPPDVKVVLAAMTADGVMQCCVALNTDGTFAFYRGDPGGSGTLLATSTATATVGTFFRLGLVGTVSYAAGALALHYDSTRDTENVILRISGENTAADNDEDRWQGMYVGLGPGFNVCHLQASDGDRLIHGLKVVSRVSNAVGAGTNSWTASAGTVAQATDDSIADFDSTYIYATAIGQEFSVTHSALPAGTVAVHAVLQNLATQNIAGSGASPSIEPQVVIDGTAYRGPWQSVVTEDWRGIWRVLRTNPRTELPWTPTNAIEAEYGGRVQS